jgi:hypothetical protein
MCSPRMLPEMATSTSKGMTVQPGRASANVGGWVGDVCSSHCSALELDRGARDLTRRPRSTDCRRHSTPTATVRPLST